MTAARRAAFPLSEADFQTRVIDLAIRTGWMVTHFRPAWDKKAERMRTHLTGHAGFPDLALARDGVVILAELKSDTGRLDDNQKAWQVAIGAQGRVWAPRDWAEVQTTLTAPRGVVVAPRVPERTLATERRRVVRIFQKYTPEQRAQHAAAGVRRGAVGGYFYTHPDVPGIAFDKRDQAAHAGLAAGPQS